jgi:hypothetical protein
MNAVKRPLSVTIIACAYLLVGTIAFVFYFKQAVASPSDGVWIELTELIAILCGVFLLRGANWARWLTVAWIAFHVVISYPDVRKLVVHGLICIAIAWVLFRPEANRYFRNASPESA